MLSKKSKLIWKNLLFGLGPVLPLIIGMTAYQMYPVWGKQSPRKLSASGFDITPMSSADVERSYYSLPSYVTRVCRDQGTERPYPYDNGYDTFYKNKEDGVYVSAVSGLPLFDSKDKYESGSGWPSFTRPIDQEHVHQLPDYSLSTERVEVLDAKARSHLGHVFDDGPPPHHKRFCINGAALQFIPRAEFNAKYPDYKPAVDTDDTSDGKNEL